jgi:nucleoside-diphosphate-sugar epimerase
MQTVVVGGSGFLGIAVVAELLRRGDSVTVLDPRANQTALAQQFGDGAVTAAVGDMLRPESLRRHFDGADEVYHMGGKLGTSELEDSMHIAVAANITGTINIFETAVAAGVPAVFYPTKPNVWLNTYTVTKVAAEQFAMIFNELHPIQIRSLRYFNAYGPGQALGPVRKIIPSFAARALLGQPIEVYGDGTQTVDMIFSEDVGRITVDFMRSGYRGGAIDCGRGIALTVNEVAEAVNDVAGSRSGVVHLPMRRGETPGTKLVADVRPLAHVLPHLSLSDWMDTLALTVDSYARRRRTSLAMAVAV